MRWRSTETPTFAGSAGTHGKPAYVETMELVDRDGNVVTSFTKDVTRSTALEVDGSPIAQTIYSTTVTLTNAQILTLPTVPVEVIPAQGAGSVIVPIFAHIEWNRSFGAYTIPDGASLGLYLAQYVTTSLTLVTSDDGSAHEIIALGCPNLQTGTGDFAGQCIVGSFPIESMTNVPLVLSDSVSGVSNYTGGHVSNRMIVTVKYYVHQLAA